MRYFIKATHKNTKLCSNAATHFQLNSNIRAVNEKQSIQCF